MINLYKLKFTWILNNLNLKNLKYRCQNARMLVNFSTASDELRFCVSPITSELDAVAQEKNARLM